MCSRFIMIKNQMNAVALAENLQDKVWYYCRCNSCGKMFGTSQVNKTSSCPDCGSSDIIHGQNIDKGVVTHNASLCDAPVSELSTVPQIFEYKKIFIALLFFVGALFFYILPGRALAVTGLTLTGSPSAVSDGDYCDTGTTNNGAPVYLKDGGSTYLYYTNSLGGHAYIMIGPAGSGYADADNYAYRTSPTNSSTFTGTATWQNVRAPWGTSGTSSITISSLGSCGGGGGGGATSTASSTLDVFQIVVASGSPTSTVYITQNGLEIVNNLTTLFAFIGCVILMGILVLVSFKLFK